VAKMQQILFNSWAPPGPAGGAYNSPPDPLAGLRALLLRGKQGRESAPILLEILNMPLAEFHHAMFNHLEVIMLTNKQPANKQMLLKTSTSLCCAMLVSSN